VNGWQDWLNLVGGLLNIIGFAFAIRGLASLKSDLFLGRPMPLGQLVQQFDFRLRRLFGKNPLTVGEVSAATGGAGTVTGRLELSFAEPRPEAGADEMFKYLREWIKELDRRQQEDREVFNGQLRQAENSVNKQLSDLDKRLSGGHQKVLTAVAGPEGKGLDAAWWGLVLALLGTILQLVATIGG
jgi:hypothetical protein